MKFFLTPIAIAIGIGVGWYVYRDSELSSKEEPRPKIEDPVGVYYTQLQKRSMKDQVELIGRMEATSEILVRSKIDGYIEKLPFDIGDEVPPKVLVVKLDGSSQKEAVSKADATLQVAEAQLKAQEARQKQAQNVVDRFRQLTGKGASTEQELEAAESVLDIAKAEVALEKARVAEAKSDLAQSNLDLNDTMLYTFERKGIVAERFVEPGDLAHPSDPLLRIIDLSTVKMVGYVVEVDYEKVQIGQEAEIRVDAFPDRIFRGKVIRKSPVLNLDTRSAMVQIEIPNSDGLLKPGLTSRATITLSERKNASVVPLESLIYDDEKPSVYVVEGNPPVATLKPIKTGIKDAKFIEVVSGIGEKEKIVTLGSRLVEPGQSIKLLVDPKQSSNASNQSETSDNLIAD